MANVPHSYIRVPLPGQRAIVLPAEPRAARLSGLRLYAPNARGGAFCKGLLSLGFGSSVVAKTLYATDPAKALRPYGFVATKQFLDLVKQIVSSTDCLLAVWVNVPGPQRKPIVLAMAPDGKLLAYIKIGWTEITKRLVENESRALSLLNKQRFRFGTTPRLIYTGQYDELTLLAMEPLNFDQHPASRAFTELHLRFLMELAQVQLQSLLLEESKYFQDMQDRLLMIEPHVAADSYAVLIRARDRLLRHFNGVELPWTWSTGDFTPWNVRLNPQSNQLEVLDFEYSVEQAPPGLDLFTFALSAEQGSARRPENIVQRLGVNVGTYFSYLQISHEFIPSLLLMHFLNRFLFNRNLWATGEVYPAAKKWFDENIREIGDLTCRI